MTINHTRVEPAPAAPRAPVGHAVVDLVAQSDVHLADAFIAATPADRFRNAHLAALRSAAAVLAAQPAHPGTGGRRRRGPRNVWTDLPDAAPDLGEWATYFAGTASKREAVEAGLSSAVGAEEAHDLLEHVESFRGIIGHRLGLPYQAPLAGSVERMVS